MLIEQRESDLRIPNLRFDQIDEGAVSPFAKLYHQYVLVHKLASKFGRLNATKMPAEVFEILDVIKGWTSSISPELTLLGPDTSKDLEHPWIPAQRAQLHCFVQEVKLTPTKPFMIRPISHTDPHEYGVLRQLAVTAAMETIESALHFLRILRGVRTRYHFVMFVLFDTAAAICSALIHDGEKSLPSRHRLLQTVVLAIRGLEQLPIINVSASGATRLLKWLSSRIPLAEDEKLFLRAMHNSSEGMSDTSASASGFQDHLDQVSTPASRQPVDSSAFDAVDQTQLVEAHSDIFMGYASNEADWEAMLDIDLGSINQIWDYSSLDLPGTMH
jgi:hypothetical protein